MAALTKGRVTPRREGRKYAFPVGAGKTLYTGGLVSLLTAGAFATPGGTAASGPAVGVATGTVINSGADGAVTVEVERGEFRFGNSAAADAITRADIGKRCFIVDDQTVAKTDNSAARPVAGTITDVDAQGVWVDVGGPNIYNA